MFFKKIWLENFPQKKLRDSLVILNSENNLYLTSLRNAHNRRWNCQKFDLLNYLDKHPACSFSTFQSYYKQKINVNDNKLIPASYKAVNEFMVNRWESLYPNLFLNPNWLLDEVIIYDDANLNDKFIVNQQKKEAFLLNINFCTDRKIDEFCKMGIDHAFFKITGAFSYDFKESSLPKKKYCDYVGKRSKHFVKKQKIAKKRTNGWLIILPC